MSRRQWLHLPLLLVVLVLAVPGCLCAVGYRFIMLFIHYLHRVYVPGDYVRDDMIQALKYTMRDEHFTRALALALEQEWPVDDIGVCTIPADDHGDTCNGWPRLDCAVHPSSEFAQRPGQKIVDNPL